MSKLGAALQRKRKKERKGRHGGRNERKEDAIETSI